MHAGCWGTRVTPPALGDCFVGHACSWELQLYDANDEPAVTGLDGGLHLGLNCSCDRRDCRSVKQSWGEPGS
eukprot:SAG31_NODE_42259_length_272_cov_0.895954_1_plen_71_part_01